MPIKALHLEHLNVLKLGNVINSTLSQTKRLIVIFLFFMMAMTFTLLITFFGTVTTSFTIRTFCHLGFTCLYFPFIMHLGFWQKTTFSSSSVSSSHPHSQFIFAFCIIECEGNDYGKNQSENRSPHKDMIINITCNV